jgi:hypothetical protein
MKTLAVGSELSHADGQIDITELTVGFSNFTNAPKNSRFVLHKLRQFSVQEIPTRYKILKRLSIQNSVLF